jgi:hypothetical protein
MTTMHTAPRIGPSLDDMALIAANLSAYPHPFYSVDFSPAADGDYDEQATLDERRTRVELGPAADVISSEVVDRPGMHTIMLDVDHPVMVETDTTGSVITVRLMTDLSLRTLSVKDVITLGRFLRANRLASWLAPTNGRDELSWHTPYPVRVVPTSTPGHHHVYVDQLVDTATLMGVLEKFGLVDVVQFGYAAVSSIRGGAHLRLPWVRKAAPIEPEPERAGLATWAAGWLRGAR